MLLWPDAATAVRGGAGDGGTNNNGWGGGGNPLPPLARLWENARNAVRSDELQGMREALAEGARHEVNEDFDGFAQLGPKATPPGRGVNADAERVRQGARLRRRGASGAEPEDGGRSWLDYFPRVRCHFEPSTTLKLRKRFYPLKTRLTLGADYNTQLGIWQFISSWEDQIIGGRLSFRGRELQLSKKWMLKIDEASDLIAKLTFRAALDTSTGATYAKFGWRFEKLEPINVREGIPWRQKLPLDGPDGHVKLEVRAKFALPEPDIEYSSTKDSEGSMIVGMGDVEVRVQELNLLMEY